MKAINLLSATNKIESLASEFVKVHTVNIQFTKRFSNKEHNSLEATVFYLEDGKTTNFTVYVYAFMEELTIENLYKNVKEKLKEFSSEQNN